jgi:hypothetical protein
VIRVKWSLHAREEIILELLRHLRGNATRVILERERKSAREMLEEQEAVRGRLFTIQDVMQSTVRAWLQVHKVFHTSARYSLCIHVLFRKIEINTMPKIPFYRTEAFVLPTIWLFLEAAA